MRKVSEKQVLYNKIIATPRLSEARQDWTQRQWPLERGTTTSTRHRQSSLPYRHSTSHLLTKSAISQPVDHDRNSASRKLIDQIRSVQLPVQTFSRIHASRKDYTLLTWEPPASEEDRYDFLRPRDYANADHFGVGTAASTSRAVFLDSVRSISLYGGTPAQRVRTIRRFAEFKPFNHPQASELLVHIREGNYLEIQRLVINDKSLLKVQDSVGSTPLHLAVKRKDLQLVKMLLVNGADVDSTDLAKRTPLFLAARKDLFDIAKILLKCKANGNFPTINGQTPAEAAKRGSSVWKLLHPDITPRLDKRLMLRTILPASITKFIPKH